MSDHPIPDEDTARSWEFFFVITMISIPLGIVFYEYLFKKFCRRNEESKKAMPEEEALTGILTEGNPPHTDHIPNMQDGKPWPPPVAARRRIKSQQSSFSRLLNTTHKPYRFEPSSIISGQPAGPAPLWTYATYVGGNNNLSTSAPTQPQPPNNFAGDCVVADLLYALGGANSGSNENVNVACWCADANPTTNAKWRSGVFSGPGVPGQYPDASDPTKYSGATGFIGLGSPTQTYDASDPATLEEFVRGIKTTAPSTYTCLVLWGHGYAWAPDGLLEDESLGGVVNCMQVDRNPFYRSDRSLASALEAVGGVDVLAWDTCLGMSVENVYTLRSSCQVLVGNCDYTGWYGIDHKFVVQALRASGTSPSTPEALGRLLVDNYAPQLDGTLNFAVAAYQPPKCGDKIRNVVAKLAYALIQWMESNTQANSAIVTARNSIRRPNYINGQGGNGEVDSMFVDVARLAIEIKQTATKSGQPAANAVAAACDEVLPIVLDGGQKHSYRHCTDAWGGLSGMSLWFPSNAHHYTMKSLTPDQSMYSDVYDTLGFNTDPFPVGNYASWSAFLKTFFGFKFN